jgi:Domain of unknown function (DUF4281)
METVFSLSGVLVMPIWLAMILVPGWSVTRRVVASPLVALAPALLYAVLVVPRIVELLPMLAAPELESIAQLLGTPDGATIAWIHFLAFDVFVGRWVYLDARERKMSAWVSSPILFFVLMFGPLGFLMHLVARRMFGQATHAAS